MTSLDLPQHPRILVITLRRLGDVLLTTPLIRTLKRGLAGSSVTALVFRGTEGILAGNPDVDEVLATSERPSLAETAALVRRLWRGYDLTVSTQAGDRPTFFALMAARRRVGLVPRPGQTGAWWKRHAHHIPVVAEPDCHRVTQLLGLARALGLEQAPDIVCPQGGAAEEFTPRMPYASCMPVRFIAQALDRRGVARLGARTGRARTGAGSDRRARPRGASLYRRPVGACRSLGDARAWPSRLGEPECIAQRRGDLYRAGYVYDPPRGRKRLPDHRAFRSDQPPADRAMAAGRTGRTVGSFRYDPAPRKCVGGAEPVTLLAVREARLRRSP